MQHVPLEGTDLHVSRLAFGTASIHHLFRQGDRIRLLGAAFTSGITHFDTSPYYGFGLAESDLGRFMQTQRSHLTVATKVGLYSPGGEASNVATLWARKAAGRVFKNVALPRVNWSISAAERSLSESLRRLRTDYIDILFLHEPDPLLVQSDEFLTWFEGVQSQGKIRYWGLAGDPERLVKWLTHRHPIARVVQARDSGARREADILSRAGRFPQFTYGYLSAASQNSSPLAIMRDALIRNAAGSIVFSTRKQSRISDLSGCVV